jgi:hypothetical protein
MNDLLTRVVLIFARNKVNLYLRFGWPFRDTAIDRQRRVAEFASGDVFGLVRWEANRDGKTSWQLSILQTRNPAESLQRFDAVFPGVAIPLHVEGDRVADVLELVDRIEDQGINPRDVPPDVWQTVASHFRDDGKNTPATAERHALYVDRPSPQ